MALASLVILSIFQNQENISVRKLNIREKIYIPIQNFYFYLRNLTFFLWSKNLNGEMLIKYCAILFMSVSISVSGETKICLSFPMCNDHHNESMRNQMVRKDQGGHSITTWTRSVGGGVKKCLFLSTLRV